MKLRQLTLVLATLAFLSPTVVNAREVNVRAGNVSIQTNKYGDIHVDTDGTSIYVPDNNSSVSTAFPRRRYYYWRRYRYTNCSGSSTYSQQSTQTTTTGRGTVTQTSVVTHCR